MNEELNHSRKPAAKARKVVPALICLFHVIIYILLASIGYIPWYELFNVMLLGSNLFIAYVLATGRGDFLIGTGIMLLILAHTAINQFIAPDSLTSGAILMVNILILYAGVNIYLHRPRVYWYLFLVSYVVLFFLFVMYLDNAEPLFLMFLMGLAATGHRLKLLAYFWALVLSFTLFQPYSWEALFITFFILTILFSAKGALDSTTARVFLAVGLVLLFFVLLPVFVVILKEDPRSMLNLLKDERVVAAFRTTIFTSIIATAFLIVFGVPLAYAIARLDFRGKTFLQALVNVPIIVPQSVAGIALLQVFGRQQFLGETFARNFGVTFDGTVMGIILAQVFVAMPFLVKTVVASFEAVPVRLEMAARTLGASPFKAFMRTSVALASRGIVLGAILAWARSAAEFGALLFIAPNPETVPILAFNRFQSLGMAETGPLVAMAMLFSLAMFFLLQLVVRALPGGSQKRQII